MARDRQTMGTCPQCHVGQLTCTYNLFQKEGLTIHSWEHRCADCGHRLTQAFRSDQPPPEPAADPTVCPFCSRSAASA